MTEPTVDELLTWLGVPVTEHTLDERVARLERLVERQVDLLQIIENLVDRQVGVLETLVTKLKQRT